MIVHGDDSHVRVIGRTLRYQDITYIDYSCSAIEFLFTGTRAEAVLWSDGSSFESIHRAVVAVFVDEEETPSKRLVLDKEEDTYLLYQGTKAKETKIRLVKYSEVAFGRVGIKGIITDGTKPVPTQAGIRKLEFIGDSITCGYGIEGVLNVDTFTTAQENPWEAYAATTARALNADYHLISWSGIGIISNYTEEEIPNDSWLMPAMYPYTDKATDLALGNKELSIWNNKAFIPDCIIINLGTNDQSYTKKIPDRVETFGREYHKFIKNVRNLNPYSKILCTLGAMGQDLCAEIEHQVNLLTTEGIKDIYYMAFDDQLETDGIGADWHPTKITHNKMAARLVGKLEELMNW
jgi:lysophospholipase L1-like esterase